MWVGGSVREVRVGERGGGRERLGRGSGGLGLFELL